MGKPIREFIIETTLDEDDLIYVYETLIEYLTCVDDAEGVVDVVTEFMADYEEALRKLTEE